jgi:AcrR family transcriptional regulator
MSEGARQQQKKQTRERILDAAGRLMADGRGLDSLGLREVAREAGLAATSLYNHFPDMEALGLALIDRACFHLRSSMAEGRRSMIEVGAARAVRELVARFVRFQQDYENEFRLLVQQRLGRRSMASCS